VIISLADNPKPQGCKKLKGRDGFRVRVGNYRIIYDVNDKILIVDVMDIGHRKDIYR
jgi:mRNA interferase RelE/StbE